MKYEIILHWCECDKEFHYELYVNDLWICAFCNLSICMKKLKEVYWRLQR